LDIPHKELKEDTTFYSMKSQPKNAHYYIFSIESVIITTLKIQSQITSAPSTMAINTSTQALLKEELYREVNHDPHVPPKSYIKWLSKNMHERFKIQPEPTLAYEDLEHLPKTLRAESPYLREHKVMTLDESMCLPFAHLG
jgi:hypothetical protein